jgi:hypothetical protein
LIEVRQVDALGPITIELAVPEGELTPDESAQAEQSTLTETGAVGDGEVDTEPSALATGAVGDEAVAAESSVPDETDASGDEAVAAEPSAPDETDASGDEAVAAEPSAPDETDASGDEAVATERSALETDVSGDQDVTSEPLMLIEPTTPVPAASDAVSDEAPSGDGEQPEGSSGPEPRADMDEDVKKGSE